MIQTLWLPPDAQMRKQVQHLAQDHVAAEGRSQVRLEPDSLNRLPAQPAS